MISISKHNNISAQTVSILRFILYNGYYALLMGKYSL